MKTKPHWLNFHAIYISTGEAPIESGTNFVWFNAFEGNIYGLRHEGWVRIESRYFPKTMAYFDQIRRIMGYAE